MMSEDEAFELGRQIAASGRADAILRELKRRLAENDWNDWDGVSMSEEIAVEYVGTYLAIKAQIADLEVAAGEARQATIDALRATTEKPGKAWVFEGLGTVAVVKGRVTEKLDRAKLARAGVAADVLDAATVRTEGEPSVRISPWTGGPKDKLAARGWKADWIDKIPPEEPSA